MSLLPNFFNAGQLFSDPFWRAGSAQNALDLFDPFDEFDRDLSRGFHWFLKPSFQGDLSLFPRVPQKYRISVDCSGFSPRSIKTEISQDENKLTVSAHEEHKAEGSDDFMLRQLKKTYQLPQNAITDQMISFMANNGQLIIEFPLRETDTQRVSDLFPQVIDAAGGQGKQVQMKFSVPENIDPNKVNISVKGHDVILRAEDKLTRPDSVSRVHYYQRTTLPENTLLEQLKCYRDSGNQITITAPMVPGSHQIQYRKVPIENWPQQQPQLDQSQQQQQQQQQIPKTQQSQPTSVNG